MIPLTERYLNFLLEQDSKILTLRNAILNKTPITIDYGGPVDVVLPGKRIDIQPIVMGKHKTSGNLVIWAYVFKGVSKKGLPNWKMFRVDRIKSINYKMGISSFILTSIPGYIQGKAPDMMKSLQSVDVYSPYIEKKTTQPQQKIEPETPFPTNNMLSNIVKNKEEKQLTKIEKDDLVDKLYKTLENKWKTKQRYIIGGNQKPGEGTRSRLRKDAENEVDYYMKKNNITLVETKITPLKKRFNRLII